MTPSGRPYYSFYSNLNIPSKSQCRGVSVPIHFLEGSLWMIGGKWTGELGQKGEQNDRSQLQPSRRERLLMGLQQRGAGMDRFEEIFRR